MHGTYDIKNIGEVNDRAKQCTDSRMEGAPRTPCLAEAKMHSTGVGVSAGVQAGKQTAHRD